MQGTNNIKNYAFSTCPAAGQRLLRLNAQQYKIFKKISTGRLIDILEVSDVCLEIPSNATKYLRFVNA